MKFMIMMNAPRGNGDWGVMSWPAKDLLAHIDYMKTVNRGLVQAGELVTAEGLGSPGEARLVRARPDGAPETDGPFAETKEFLAGFWIVDVESLDRALAIAAEVSLAPGPGGAPLYLPVEVREVMSAPPDPAAA
ncbi:MAG: hypothetical protein KC635_16675 [Myxococcales bacterium]|nr:hypothetical protein [Myxococcales bacterium]